MSKRILILVFLVGQICYSQETVDKKVFEESEIQVLATETIESSKANKRAALKFKFIDYADKKIKIYEAELNKDEFVSLKNYKYCLLYTSPSPRDS